MIAPAANESITLWRNRARAVPNSKSVSFPVARIDGQAVRRNIETPSTQLREGLSAAYFISTRGARKGLEDRR